jgi:hypothetical protein
MCPLEIKRLRRWLLQVFGLGRQVIKDEYVYDQ